MKSRESLVRLKLFQVREKRRHIAQLDMMRSELQRMADELEAQIAYEEKKAGISDVDHFAYPTFARAARQRHDNLIDSLNDLQNQRALAEKLLSEAEAELERAEAMDEREGKTRQEPVEFVQKRAMIG